MRITNSRDQIEFAQLSKLIKKSRFSDIRNYNAKEIEAAVRKGVSIRTTKRKLCAGNNVMHPVKDRQGDMVKNFNNTAEVAEEFYSELYSSNTR